MKSMMKHSPNRLSSPRATFRKKKIISNIFFVTHWPFFLLIKKPFSFYKIISREKITGSAKKEAFFLSNKKTFFKKIFDIQTFWKIDVSFGQRRGAFTSLVRRLYVKIVRSSVVRWSCLDVCHFYCDINGNRHRFIASVWRLMGH